MSNKNFEKLNFISLVFLVNKILIIIIINDRM